MENYRPLPKRLLSLDCVALAQALLGRVLVHESPQGRCAGIIVETEAYNETEPASHCYVGPTERNRIMFDRGGVAYVYRSYGVHWCANIVAGRHGFGEAVLLRAIEPIEGIPLMCQRRFGRSTGKLVDIARGPGRLCAAMGISSEHYGADLERSALRIVNPIGRFVAPPMRATPRIGISKAKSLRWRYCVPGDPYVSGPKRWR